MRTQGWGWRMGLERVGGLIFILISECSVPGPIIRVAEMYDGGASSLRKKKASRWCDWKAMWIKYPAPPKGHVPSDSLKTARFQLPIFPPPSKAPLPAGDPSVNPWALWEKSHCWLWLIGRRCSLSIICWMSCSFLKYFPEGLSSSFNKELPAPVRL